MAGRFLSAFGNRLATGVRSDVEEESAALVIHDETRSVLAPFLAAATFAGASCSTPPATAPASPPAIVPAVHAHGLVFVEVGGALGEPLLALLDTGASVSAIDPRRSSGLPALARSEVVGTTGSIEVENVALEGLTLGSFPLPKLSATRRDLAGLLSPDAREVDMILGSDAFAGLVLTIDFGASRIEVSGMPATASGVEVPMELDNGIPTIPASLSGIATTLRIDTGASLFETEDVYVNVPARIWDALRALDPELAPTKHFQGTGASGETVELPVARVEDVRIGPRTLGHAFVIVQPEAGYFADPRAKGFVGNNFLEKLGVVTLDYGRRRLSVRARGSTS